MATPDFSAQENALGFRVYGLEGQTKTIDDAIVRMRENQARHSEAIGSQAVTIARHDERIEGVEKAVVALSDTVSKGIWALIAFAFTIAASAVGLAITLAGGPG